MTAASVTDVNAAEWWGEAMRHGRCRGLLNNVATAGMVCVLTFGLTSANASAAQHPGNTAKADGALAHRELLPVSTYPKGWKGQGSSSTNTEASFWGGANQADVQSMTTCLGITTNGVDTKPVEAAAQTYLDTNSGLSVSDTVDVFPNKAEAEADVAAAENAKIPSCVTTLEGANIIHGTLQGFGKGATTSGNLVVTLKPLPLYGDHDSFEQLALPVTYQGISGITYTDFVTIQKGRSESNFMFANQGVQPPTGLIDRMSKAAEAQMSNS